MRIGVGIGIENYYVKCFLGVKSLYYILKERDLCPKNPTSKPRIWAEKEQLSLLYFCYSYEAHLEFTSCIKYQLHTSLQEYSKYRVS